MIGNRRHIIAIAVVLLFALMFTACGGEKEPDKLASESEKVAAALNDELGTMTEDELQAIESVKKMKIAGVGMLQDGSFSSGVFKEDVAYGDIFDEKYFGLSGWRSSKIQENMYTVIFYFDSVVINGEQGARSNEGPTEFCFVWSPELDFGMPTAISVGETVIAEFTGGSDEEVILIASTISSMASVWATDLLAEQPTPPPTATPQPTAVPTATPTPEPTSRPNPTQAPLNAVPYTMSLSGLVPIYAGPGYDYNYVQIVGQDGVYTIVEECWNSNGELWGRLKSGVGWVDISYTR